VQAKYNWPQIVKDIEKYITMQLISKIKNNKHFFFTSAKLFIGYYLVFEFSVQPKYLFIYFVFCFLFFS